MADGQRKDWCDVGGGRIGVMQGRLSPVIEGKIQAFPWPYWREEFGLAKSIGVSVLEWTLDAEDMDRNPIMRGDGRREIQDLMAAHSIAIPSLTADCFMQEPFWKASGLELGRRLKVFERVVAACGECGVSRVVVPLVDSGSLVSPAECELFGRYIDGMVALLKDHHVTLALESDLTPEGQWHLVSRFPEECVGVNFDMGNSASLGWDPDRELGVVGSRVVNVHVKDRARGGGTVPFGKGSVSFPVVFKALAEAGYAGNLILQPARAADGEHVATIRRYVEQVALLLRGVA